MFFLVNRSRRHAGEKDHVMAWDRGKTWPTAPELVAAKFAAPGDMVELIQIENEDKEYRGVAYLVQSPYTYGTERLHEDGTRFRTPQEKANDWLENDIRPRADIVLPVPRCGACRNKMEDLRNIRSIADSGLCWDCRTPKADLAVSKKRKV